MQGATHADASARAARILPAGARSAARLTLALATAGAIGLSQVAPAEAQGRVSFVRDAEIEDLLRDYSRPIIRASGVGEQAVQTYIVNSRQFNAFVADGRRMFINAGVIAQADTPNEVIGVIAHEVGHMAGGHLARLRNELRGASAIALIGTLLGAGAMAAGAMTGSQSGAQAGQAMMMGGQHAAMRSLLSYQRSEEQAADRAAINYLNATSQSARGMLDTFRRLGDQSMFSARNIDPYAQSHPMPRERIALLERLAQESPHFEQRDPPELQARHDLARAKIIGYTEHRSTVDRRYPASDQSLAAHYARTIANMQSGNYRQALSDVDRLIQSNQSYPYFWELKGEMLIRAGRPREAMEPLQRATSLRPDTPLFRLTLAHAMVASGDDSLLPGAVEQLNSALQREPEHAGGHRILAQAYGRLGRVAEADLATAHASLASGDHDAARRFAQRAQQGLPHGSPAWLRADDIVKSRPPGS